MDEEINQTENSQITTTGAEAPDIQSQTVADAEIQVDVDEQATTTESYDEDAEDDSLPFPNARVVRIIKSEIQSGKQLRGEVKMAVNCWLGETLCKVSKEMDRSPYGSIGIADFNRATRPFEMITHLVKDRNRLVTAIDKLIADADQIKRDLQRFYTDLTGREEQQQ